MRALRARDDGKERAMRSRWRAPLFALALAMAATTPGLAQFDDDFVEDEAFGGDEDGEGELDEIGELEMPSRVQSAPPEASSAPVENAPEVYVVQPGDTLWDLSERFLNNPWYWPRIWSYNPNLTNPNWIQPGTRIRFYPGGAEAPVEVQPEEIDEDEEPFDDDLVDVPLFQDSGVRPPKLADANSNTGRREYFITDQDLNEAGRIRNAPEEKEMLSVFDSVYFDLKERPDPGQLLQVFEVQRVLRHPVTGENLGRVVHTLGVARVDRVGEDGEQHLGTILANWDPIYRGAYVGALEDVDVTSVSPIPNEREVEGFVVDTARYPTRHIGQNHIIFIDRGQNAGVQVGNTFVVLRRGDAFTGEVRKMVDEDIGRLLVVDVGERGSTAVVIESDREIVAGDRIHMRPGE